ncbi:MAG TPA: DUF6456 domain-containing protein [Caulobacteraceae bacterium]|jgi:hypothetical protein
MGVHEQEDAERAAERAARLLSRSGAWLAPEGGGYAVRADADRRRRPLMRLDEAGFRRLAREPGLKPRGEGWTVLAAVPDAAPDGAARPSVIDGERAVAEADGRVRSRRANLGESPIAWLARRRDAQGRPWLTAAEAAAGEKLREDFHLAGTIGRLTMAWDAAPRGGAARGPGLDPVERGMEAKRRVAAALEAAGPGLREMLEHVCLRGSALEAAERGLGLPGRSGKTVLKLALQRLAAHYRIG